MPSDMLSPLSGTSGQTVQITIGRGEVSSLPGNVREKIGDKPLIQLTMSINGKQTAWSNHNAPVTVSIPFTPTAEELANPENMLSGISRGRNSQLCDERTLQPLDRYGCISYNPLQRLCV
jgi:hypothetical protein